MADDHARNHPIARAIDVCRLAAGEQLTLDELARRLNVHPRTVRRTLYALQAAGVDIEALERAQAREGAPRNRRVYRLDRRAWLGLLDLPAA